MNRRRFLAGGLALPFLRASPLHSGDRIPIADMHFHLFFPGITRSVTAPIKPLRRTMEDGGITLLSWSLVGDMPWIRPTPQRLRQVGAPEGDAALTWFKKEMGRIKAHISEQGLKIALTSADIDRALDGEPHVLLSVEGATFLDGNPDTLKLAYDMGVRHLQLVHYIRNEIGDFQTEKPEHGGLTDRGKEIVAACNAMGMLIDLAHATGPVVDEVLARSKTPVVWSHSAIAKGPEPSWTMPMPFARHLSLARAKAIAAKGGVIGLWPARPDAGSTPATYAMKLAEMADTVGEDHVGIGTDSGAFAKAAVTAGADLRQVVEHLLSKGTDRARIEKLAIRNYARVLKAALLPG